VKVTAFVCHERGTSKAAHPSSDGGGETGKEIEIALSNAINYVDYRRSFCCHDSFARARVCPKGTNDAG